MNLKLGDKIYFSQYNRLSSCETIIKVTPKMFKTKSYYLEARGDYINVRSSSKFNTVNAKLATPELDRKWEEQKMLSWFSSHDFTIEERIKVYELLNPNPVGLLDN